MVKELRIGNLVKQQGSNFVESVTLELLCRSDVILEPIQLNEEWLLKFGFYKSLNSYCKRKSKFMLFNNNWNKKDKELDFVINGYDSIQIKHVHQLQNLYFALTGNEL